MMRQDDTIRDRIREKFLTLRLKKMAEELDNVLQLADEENSTACQAIEKLLDIQIIYRENRIIQERIRKARLQELVTIDAFDFNFHKSRKKYRARIMNLLDLEFIRQKKDVILLGNPGVGKSFLMKCIALAACRAKFTVLCTSVMDMLNILLAAKQDYTLGKKLHVYRSPSLLCLDELGYLSLDKQGADLLFQVLSDRSGRSSSLITTNKPFSDWGEILGSTTLAGALADRLVANCEVITFERSFRSKNL